MHKNVCVVFPFQMPPLASLFTDKNATQQFFSREIFTPLLYLFKNDTLAPHHCGGNTLSHCVHQSFSHSEGFMMRACERGFARESVKLPYSGNQYKRELFICKLDAD